MYKYNYPSKAPWQLCFGNDDDVDDDDDDHADDDGFFFGKETVVTQFTFTSAKTTVSSRLTSTATTLNLLLLSIKPRMLTNNADIALLTSHKLTSNAIVKIGEILTTQLTLSSAKKNNWTTELNKVCIFQFLSISQCRIRDPDGLIWGFWWIQ